MLQIQDPAKLLHFYLEVTATLVNMILKYLNLTVEVRLEDHRAAYNISQLPQEKLHHLDMIHPLLLLHPLVYIYTLDKY